MNATANAGVMNYADVAAIHSVTAAVNANAQVKVTAAVNADAEVAEKAEVVKEGSIRIGRISG